jgi:RNA polymerase sigma-70 factor (ECF subfamily)
MSSTAVIGSDERLTEEDRGLLLEVEIERFLREVEKRAYRIAAISIGDRDEAFDVVQDAMISLTGRYTSRPSEEWRPLFYRILNNRIRDWHRRRRVRDSVLRYFGGQADEDADPIALARDPAQTGPHDEAQRDEAMAALERALGELPARQREAFMLRNFEGLDVAETAVAMRCSSGSVKTHFSRATHRLREILDEYYE